MKFSINHVFEKGLLTTFADAFIIIEKYLPRYLGSVYMSDPFHDLHRGLPRGGLKRTRYTRKAYRMIPELDRPRILDVGCGTGVPTVELARLSGGKITAVDINREYLNALSRRAKKAGVSNLVKTLRCSMVDMDFLPGSFDIIWAEGSIWRIGLETGLNEWRKYIVPGGYMVVHEVVWLHSDPPDELQSFMDAIYLKINTVERIKELIAKCGYGLIGSFKLPARYWWTEYYEPLEKRIPGLRIKYTGDAKAHSLLDRAQEEISLLKKYPGFYGSAFFVMKKQAA